jgi:(2Fe-2S) ferredoxin
MLQTLNGRFLRWQRSKSGQLKSIQVQTSTIIQSVYIGKKLRAPLFDLLTANMAISLQVKVRKRHPIAKFIVLLASPELEVSRSVLPQPIEVKVCSSKHCCKSGSKDICSSLEQLQLDSNIGIQIKKVSCLGNCRNAPVVKIEGHKYDRLSPQLAMQLVIQRSTAIKKSCFSFCGG